MRHNLMGGAVHDIAASRRNAAGRPGHSRTANQALTLSAPVHHVVRRTRIGGLWIAAALFALVILLPLLFILETARARPSATSAPTAATLRCRPPARRRLRRATGRDPGHRAHHPAPHHRTPSPPPRRQATGLARRYTTCRPPPPPGSRRPGQPCRHVRRRHGHQAAARTAPAPRPRRFRLDLPPACDGRSASCPCLSGSTSKSSSAHRRW